METSSFPKKNYFPRDNLVELPSVNGFHLWVNRFFGIVNSLFYLRIFIGLPLGLLGLHRSPSFQFVRLLSSSPWRSIVFPFYQLPMNLFPRTSTALWKPVGWVSNRNGCVCKSILWCHNDLSLSLSLTLLKRRTDADIYQSVAMTTLSLPPRFVYLIFVHQSPIERNFLGTVLLLPYWWPPLIEHDRPPNDYQRGSLFAFWTDLRLRKENIESPISISLPIPYQGDIMEHRKEKWSIVTCSVYKSLAACFSNWHVNSWLVAGTT